MPLDAFKKIAINFAVVFIVASIFSGMAPGTYEKAFAFFEEKLGFGEPSIGYFAVTPGSDETFSVRYSILGSYGDVREVVVSRSYSSTPDGQPEGRVEVGEASLKENVLKSLNDYRGALSFSGIPIESEGMGRLGLNKFLLEVFLKNGEVISDEIAIGFYDEYYLENYKGKIGGKEYDVAKCKKGTVDAYLAKKLYTDTRYLISQSQEACMQDVSSYDNSGFWYHWCKEVYMKEHPTCNCYDDGLKGCTGNEIDELYFDASRMWMWGAACIGEDEYGKSGEREGSFSMPESAALGNYEAKYSQLSEERLLKYMGEGIYGKDGNSKDKLSIFACSNIVKAELDAIGFVPIEPNTRGERAESMLSDILRQVLGPRVSSLTAKFQGPISGPLLPGQVRSLSVALNWKLEEFGKEDLGGLRLDYDKAGGNYLRNVAVEKDGDGFGLSIESSVISSNIKVAGQGSLPGQDSFSVEGFSQMFRLVPIDKSGNENLKGVKEAGIKVFDDNYLEYYYLDYVYRKNPDGSYTKICGNCDLQGEKVLVLNRGKKSERLAAYSAMLSRLGVSKLPECGIYQEKVLSSCRPDYSDELYINYLNRVTGDVERVKRLDSCQEVVVDNRGGISNRYVCEFKKRVKEKLVEAGWEYVPAERILPMVYS